MPITVQRPTGTSAQLLANNGVGGFSNVTIGAGLLYTGGTLTSTDVGGTVTSVSVVTANGFGGTVATSTSTPAITVTTSITGVLKGNGTAISAATAGTDYVTPTGTETLTNKTIQAGINAQTGTTYTLVATDFSSFVTASNVSAQTYTLPKQATLATNTGVSTTVVNIGAGLVTFVIESGDTLTGNATLATGQSATIRRLTSTNWEIFGGTATVNEGFTIPIIKAATASDVAYFTLYADYAGTILSCSQIADSLGTAGTYTVSIDGVSVTGLTTVTNVASKTTTSASAANTFSVGSVIKLTLSGAVVAAVNYGATLLTTRTY